MLISIPLNWEQNILKYNFIQLQVSICIKEKEKDLIEFIFFTILGNCTEFGKPPLI